MFPAGSRAHRRPRWIFHRLSFFLPRLLLPFSLTHAPLFLSLSLSLWPTSLWRSSEPTTDVIKAFVCGCLGCMHVRLTATKSHWLQPTQPLVPLIWSAANRCRYFHARASGRQSICVIFVVIECFICQKGLEECMHDFSLQLNYNMLQKHEGLQVSFENLHSGLAAGFRKLVRSLCLHKLSLLFSSVFY